MGAPVRGHSFHRRVQHHAERPQVRLGSRTLPQHPLGCDELGRADEGAGLRQPLLALDLGDAEVGEHHAIAPAQQDVVRLDIAVQHPGLMGGRERAEHVEPDPGGLPDIEGALLETVGERLAVHQLHDDPRLAVLDRRRRAW